MNNSNPFFVRINDINETLNVIAMRHAGILILNPTGTRRAGGEVQPLGRTAVVERLVFGLIWRIAEHMPQANLSEIVLGGDGTGAAGPPSG